MMALALEDRIRKRAYEIWEARQATGQYLIVDRLGNEREITAEDDWVEATNEIIKEEKLAWG